MKKEHIIREIKRTAKENGGKPLGKKRFQQETGIREADWNGKYWKRWNEAVVEAGFTPNVMNKAHSEDYLIQKIIELIRETKKFPTASDFKYKNHHEDWPNVKTFYKRLGKKSEMAEMVYNFCKKTGGLTDIQEICRSFIRKAVDSEVDDIGDNNENFGYVYMMKHGNRPEYKIGKSNSPGRREYDIGLILPRDVKLIHQIATDDPEGIEKYWHNRFKDKLLKGEWFKLTPEDIRAFKRRKLM